MADGTKAPKGALITGLVLILLAFGGCGYGCVSGFGLIGDLADAIDSANSTPLNQATTLRATGDNGLILSSDRSAVCYVADPDGKEVAVDTPPSGTSGSYDQDGTTLELAYVFDTEVGTTYDVICGDEAGTLTGSYAVVPIPSLDSAGGIITGLGSGAALFLLGLIFVIVGMVKRSKWKKRQVAGVGPGYVAPPPGGVVPPPPGAAAPGGVVPPPPGAAAPAAPPPAPPVAPPPAAPAPPPAAPPTAPPPPPAAPPPPADPSTPPPPPGTA